MFSRILTEKYHDNNVESRPEYYTRVIVMYYTLLFVQYYWQLYLFHDLFVHDPVYDLYSEISPLSSVA